MRTLLRTLDLVWPAGRPGLALASVASLVARLALALPFLRSGLTRWDGFLSLSPATSFLFANVFKLHLLGAEFDLPLPGLLAWVTACAEIALPVLLMAGLLTRAAALGLLVMTAVIQSIFPEGWMNFHLYWAALALALMSMGGGLVSLDALVVWCASRSRIASPRAAQPPGA